MAGAAWRIARHSRPRRHHRSIESLTQTRQEVPGRNRARGQLMLRALAVAHIAIAILLMPLMLFPITFAPIMLIGPVWAILLGRRMWKRDPTVIRPLRRT